jgi:hypothetical protein
MLWYSQHQLTAYQLLLMTMKNEWPPNLEIIDNPDKALYKSADVYGMEHQGEATHTF